jgi:hypothetical protein
VSGFPFFVGQVPQTFGGVCRLASGGSLYKIGLRLQIDLQTINVSPDNLGMKPKPGLSAKSDFVVYKSKVVSQPHLWRGHDLWIRAILFISPPLVDSPAVCRLEFGRAESRHSKLLEIVGWGMLTPAWHAMT